MALLTQELAKEELQMRICLRAFRSFYIAQLREPLKGEIEKLEYSVIHLHT